MKEKHNIRYLVIIYSIFSIITIGSIFMIGARIENRTLAKASVISDDWFYDGIRSSKKIPFDEFLRRYPMESGTVYRISGILPMEMKGSEAIYFYTRNLALTVRLDGEEFYSLQPKEGQTATGKVSNLIALPVGCQGKQIEIEYKGLLPFPFEPITEVYYGSEADLQRNMIVARLAPAIVGILSFFISVVQTGVALVLRNHKESFKQMLYLGMFSLFFSLWMIGCSGIIEYLSGYELNGQNLHFLSLSLVSYPALRYFLCEKEGKKTKAEMMIHSLSFWNFPVILLLHAFKIFDLKQSIFITHIIAIITFIYILTVLVGQLRKQRYRGSNKGIILCLAWAFLGAMASIDIFLFYFGRGESQDRFSAIGYIVLTAILTYSSIKSAISMMDLGKRTETVAQLAYFDILTGVGNRTALNEAMDQLEVHKDKIGNIGIVQFDVNGLKEVNDNLGHLAGDQLLKSAATVIKDGFEGYGNCYRYGGDEFVVILEGNPKEKYAIGIQQMESLITKNNKYCPKAEKVSIAYGIAYYEENNKLSMWQLQELADERMYECKRKMKCQRK